MSYYIPFKGLHTQLETFQRQSLVNLLVDRFGRALVNACWRDWLGFSRGKVCVVNPRPPCCRGLVVWLETASRRPEVSVDEPREAKVTLVSRASAKESRSLFCFDVGGSPSCGASARCRSARLYRRAVFRGPRGHLEQQFMATPARWLLTGAPTELSTFSRTVPGTAWNPNIRRSHGRQPTSDLFDI